MVEYGPMELDLNLRVRVWALQAHLADAKVHTCITPLPLLSTQVTCI